MQSTQNTQKRHPTPLINTINAEIQAKDSLLYNPPPKSSHPISKFERQSHVSQLLINPPIQKRSPLPHQLSLQPLLHKRPNLFLGNIIQIYLS